MRIGYIPPPLGTVWGDVVRLLDKAVKGGENDWEEVRALVTAGRAQVWLGIDGRIVAALITKIADGTLEVWLAGGRILECLPFLETIIEESKEAGTTRATVTEGRRGWERALLPYGWRREGDLLVKRWDD